MTNPLVTIALVTLQQELEAAPKSKAGFVNWARNSKLQKVAVAAMQEAGVTENEARKLAFEVGRPFDTSYSKNKPA
jgi:hypothetical protein